MGVFDGIENIAAEGTSSLRQYFMPGHYTIEIERVFLHEKRLGGGKLFIVETKVLASDNNDIKVGEQRNWVQALAPPSALPRIKAFIGATMELCPKNQIKEINTKITSTICNESIGPNNPLNRKKLRLKCIKKITSTGKEFIQHKWGLIHG